MTGIDCSLEASSFDRVFWFWIFGFFALIILIMGFAMFETMVRGNTSILVEPWGIIPLVAMVVIAYRWRSWLGRSKEEDLTYLVGVLNGALHASVVEFGEDNDGR